MTSEGLGEMFEGDSADMCAKKILLVSLGGRADGLACADPGARTPIGASVNFNKCRLSISVIQDYISNDKTLDLFLRFHSIMTSPPHLKKTEFSHVLPVLSMKHPAIDRSQWMT